MLKGGWGYEKRHRQCDVAPCDGNLPMSLWGDCCTVIGITPPQHRSVLYFGCKLLYKLIHVVVAAAKTATLED